MKTRININPFRFRRSSARQPFDVDGCMLTDTGLLRDHNEDCASYRLPKVQDPSNLGMLALVADGMGGHAGGEVASAMAAEIVTHSYYRRAETPDKALGRAFELANQKIYRRARADRNLQGMGTTCTALAIREGFAYVAHVGDSRVYLIRDGEIIQLSEDQTLAGERIRAGLMTEEEAYRQTDGHIILQALGTREKIDVYRLDRALAIQEEDRFLLCSDGLVDVMDNQSLLKIAIQAPPFEACQRLIEQALEAGGPDNITVGIFHIIQATRNENRWLPVTREINANKSAS